jgi:DNA-binding NarL/FixJ family response regulator
MAETRPRLILADDHPMMLAGLRKLLAPGCEVVAEAADGRALLAAAERLRPDLVIADISMPGVDGLEATRRLQTSVPGARVLILSVHAEPSWVRAAFEAGACGYLTKAAVPEEIELAVRAVLDDRFYISPAVTRAMVSRGTRGAAAAGRRRTAAPLPAIPPIPAMPADVAEPLTPRELDIVLLVGQGLGNKAIALQLGLSVATVRTPLNRVYEKVGSESRVELALLAARTRSDPGAVM